MRSAPTPPDAAPPTPTSSRPPVALHDRAMENLRFIRETMERVGSFTAVPGWGGVIMGATALAAAGIAARQPTAGRWLAVWLGEAVLAVVVAVGAMARKARRAGSPLLGAAGRKFGLSFLPPLLAGALLTVALARVGRQDLLPGAWLLLYGAGIVAAGTYSVRVVPVMGVCLMLVGGAALFSPAEWGDAYLAVGFGALQVGFGSWIARRHGG